MQLVINAGSSSLKFALYQDLDHDGLVAQGIFDGLGDRCRFTINDEEEVLRVNNHEQAVQLLIDTLQRSGLTPAGSITSVVHRVVHGGERYVHPVRVTGPVLSDIDRLSLLAPLHNPANLAGIHACLRLLPNAIPVAVFDTSFHHTIAREVFLYGIPLALYREFGIRKYGFHGISHAYVAHVLKHEYGESVDAISCHLGAGSSITALRHGKSVDTTMGFTPLDGLLMATRSGELDPEIPLFLLRHGAYSLDQLEELLSHRSGLYGLTGHTDLREIWMAAKLGDERAKLALDMLAYRVAFFVNGMKTGVSRPRALVFTGGIGEGAWYVRERVLQFLGVSFDVTRNRAGKGRISTADSEVDVWVVPANEQLMMHWLSRSVLS